MSANDEIFSFRIKSELLERVKVLAERDDRNASSMMRVLVRRAVEQMEADQKERK